MHVETTHTLNAQRSDALAPSHGIDSRAVDVNAARQMRQSVSHRTGAATTFNSRKSTTSCFLPLQELVGNARERQDDVHDGVDDDGPGRQEERRGVVEHEIDYAERAKEEQHVECAGHDE